MPETELQLNNPSLIENLPKQLGLFSVQCNEPILPGQWLVNKAKQYPVFRQTNHQVQFIAAIDSDMSGKFKIAGTPLQIPDDGRQLLLLADEQAVCSMLFIIKHLQETLGLAKLRQQLKIILLGASSFPFKAVPSRFIVSSIVPDMPIDSIASAQLFEDLALPARLASPVGAAGCFDGSLMQMLEKTFSDKGIEDDTLVIAMGSRSLISGIKKLLVGSADKQLLIEFESEL